MFSPGELDTMRATQEDHMSHAAIFTPWQPAQDAASGQAINAAEPEETIICGVDFSARGTLVDGSEGTFVAHYKVRLPIEMAARARPMSRYAVVTSFGELTEKPLLLEQVTEPALGPSGVVVWARNVTV